MFNGSFVEVKQQTENLYSKYNGFYIEKNIYKYTNTILLMLLKDVANFSF